MVPTDKQHFELEMISYGANLTTVFFGFIFSVETDLKAEVKMYLKPIQVFELKVLDLLYLFKKIGIPGAMIITVEGGFREYVHFLRHALSFYD